MKFVPLLPLVFFLLIAPGRALELQWAGEFQVGKAPHQIAFSDDGRTAYIAAAGSARLGVVATGSLRVLPAIELAGVPLGVAAVGPDLLLVSRFDGQTVAALSPAGGRFAAEIAVGGAPSLFTALSDNRWLIASEKADRVTLIGAFPLREITRFASGRRPFPVAYSASRNAVYIPEYNDNTLRAIDLKSGAVLARLAVGRQPSGALVFDEDRYLAVAVRGENKIAIIALDGFRHIRDIKDGIGDGPFSLLTAPGGRHLLVNNTRSHELSIIAADTLQVVGRQAVCQIPIVLVLEALRRRLWVACEGEEDNRVQIYDVITDDAADRETAGERQAIAEVRDLHRFFHLWMRGALPDSDEVFARFTAALAGDMTFISPTGQIVSRDDLIAGVRASYGKGFGDFDFRIWTTDERVKALGGGRYLAIYREHQNGAAGYRVRQSSALLESDTASPANMPGKLLWRHVHETWIAGGPELDTAATTDG